MSAPKLQVFSRWAVPYAQAQMDDHASVCAELRELFLAREAEGDKYRNRIARDTQSGLFESTFDLHRWPDPPVRRMFDFLHASLVSVVRAVSEIPDADLGSLRFHYHSWFHVTRSGGHQGVHNHPMASWSGIFCVDPGDDAPDHVQSGIVRFVDPRGHADMYQDPANERLRPAFRLGGMAQRHKAGSLIIFPSYVLHEVTPYLGERPRIVVAFNSWCVAPPDAGR